MRGGTHGHPKQGRRQIFLLLLVGRKEGGGSICGPGSWRGKRRSSLWCWAMARASVPWFKGGQQSTIGMREVRCHQFFSGWVLLADVHWGGVASATCGWDVHSMRVRCTAEGHRTSGQLHFSVGLRSNRAPNFGIWFPSEFKPKARSTVHRFL